MAKPCKPKPRPGKKEAPAPTPFTADYMVATIIEARRLVKGAPISRLYDPVYRKS